MDTKKNITFSKLKKKEISTLVKAINFTRSLDKKKFTKKTSIKKWLWQYVKLPTKKTYCYLVKKNQTIIGYFHVPIYKISINRKNYLIGNVQDVAISKLYRGFGIFKKLSKFAVDDLKDKVDLLYTFPNNLSLENFIKHNTFSFFKYVPLYIKTTFLNFINKNKLKNNQKIIIKNYVDKKIDKLFKRFSINHSIHLIRDKSFLKWRYIDSPKGKVFAVSLTERNNLLATLIIKKTTIFGCSCIAILDFAFKGKVENLSILINNFYSHLRIKFKIKAYFILFTYFLNNENFFLKNNFFLIPKFLTPRKINILFKLFNKRLITNFNKKQSWLITLGDWDVF